MKRRIPKFWRVALILLLLAFDYATLLRALQAAEYAAYASVYSYASAAVTDPDAYREEHDWQIRKLRELAASG